MSIVLEQVSKRYDAAAAVNDVSVDIADGEFFVLLGPSGSGKSTLLRAIAGLTTIDHGRILLRGRDVTNVNPREREVGFVFQNYALFRHMTIADNIEFALRARKVRAAERRRRRMELLRLVSLEGSDNRYPSELSGGQQQRIAVARALAHEPRVLLLDEPFGALDAKIRDELRRNIREIQQAVGITTVLVTHDQEEAFSMADRIGVMDRGRLQEVGEPRTLYRHPATRFVATFLGAANLLVGQYGYRDLRLGESYFPVERWSRSLRSGDEAAVVVRPEDIELAQHAAQLTCPAVGTAEVAEMQFVGATEKLRIRMIGKPTLVSARTDDTANFLLDVARTARQVTQLPLAIGQQVTVGLREIHALPTPISSLRIIARSEQIAQELLASVLVRELGERMHIKPMRLDPPVADANNLCGLPIIEFKGGDVLLQSKELLESGARQVLAVRPEVPMPERMLIYVEPSSAARDSALAAAASLARHLTVSVTMLVRDDKRSIRMAQYRELLDLRNASLKQYGLDIRTETFRGNLGAAIAERQTAANPLILLLGVTLPTSSNSLIEEIGPVLQTSPPAALVIVNGRGEQDLRNVLQVPSAYAAAAAVR